MAKRRRNREKSDGTSPLAASPTKKQKNETNEGSQDKDAADAAAENVEAADDDPSKWSKSKRKRMRLLKSKLKKQDTMDDGAQDRTANVIEKEDAQEGSKDTPKTSLQNSFKARLAGSRFRILNEELYTTTSAESFQRFSTNPELYDQYHDGFRHQVESWPVNPVDVIVRWISNRYRTNSTSCVVADFGCGDAQLAKDLLKVKSKIPFQVHSFDLVSRNDLVTACDMSNVPLDDKSVDVCVFCLSLMGTNLADFIREAHRVLRDNGRVKIAEVRSRIEYSHAAGGKKGKPNKEKDDDKSSGTVKEFTDMLDKLGFKCVKTDQSNKMFLLLECVKNKKKPDEKLAFTAKPCIYKRR